MARDAETPAGDLLDGGIFRVALVVRPDVAQRVFAAFAGVAASAQAVHRDGERFVRLLRNRAIAHRPGLEALDDFLDRLHFLNRQRLLGILEIQQPAQRAKILRLVVDQLGVFAVNFFAAEPAGRLQFVNRLRIEQMMFAAVAPLILAAGVEFRVDRSRAETPG
jgi:hypothetical protein